MKIRKAVVPAAGYGTRFLPASKAMPKEMLPIVDKPVIQYVVEELAEAGIEQIIIVTGWHKRAIEDHFDRHLELEQKLKDAGKDDYLAEIKRISNLAEFVFVRQKEANGNGGAILTAKNIVGNEPFVVLWADEFVVARPSRVKLALDAYEKYQSTIMTGARKNQPEDFKRYGYVGGKMLDDGIMEIDKFIEKPKPEEAPSDLAILSGYIFNPDIFPALEEAQKEIGDSRELVYVDGVNNLLKQGKKAYATEIDGNDWYDCGNVTGYLKANVDIALKRSDINNEFGKFIKDTASRL